MVEKANKKNKIFTGCSCLILAIFIFIFAIFIFSFPAIPFLTLMACNPRVERGGPEGYFYYGVHPELYTVAINSLLGRRGFSLEKDRTITSDSWVRLVEEDDFGRILFTYTEHDSPAGRTFNLLISQKSDENYVYFLPHYNFLSYRHEERLLDISWARVDGQSIHTYEVVDFEAEKKIEELKILNHWNQPLDLEQAVRAPIVRRKDGVICNDRLEAAYRAAIGRLDEEPLDLYIEFTFFRTDEYGRSIYVGTELWRGREESKGFPIVVMLFQPDGSHDPERGVMQLPDLLNYQPALREFKELNRWNQP